jgi:hypothetical protein
MRFSDFQRKLVEVATYMMNGVAKQIGMSPETTFDIVQDMHTAFNKAGIEVLRDRGFEIDSEDEDRFYGPAAGLLALVFYHHVAQQTSDPLTAPILSRLFERESDEDLVNKLLQDMLRDLDDDNGDWID